MSGRGGIHSSHHLSLGAQRPSASERLAVRARHRLRARPSGAQRPGLFSSLKAGIIGQNQRRGRPVPATFSIRRRHLEGRRTRPARAERRAGRNKDLIDGRKTNVRFRSASTVEKVRSTPRTSSSSMSMATAWYSWTPKPVAGSTLPTDLLGGADAFLQDGMTVLLECCDQHPDLGPAADGRSHDRGESANAVVKGQTTSSTTSPRS